jgi:hypothetical protein
MSTKVTENFEIKLEESNINNINNLQNQMITYWKRVIDSDLKINPSKKREYQLQRYLLDQTLQENVMP